MPALSPANSALFCLLVSGLLAVVLALLLISPLPRRRIALVLGTGGILLAGAAAVVRVLMPPDAPPGAASIQAFLDHFHAVAPGERAILLQELPVSPWDLVPAARGQITATIAEKGNVESGRSAEVRCKVPPGKSNTRVGDPIRCIKWVVDKRTVVRMGQLVCALDDSDLVEQLRKQKAIVAEKQAVLTRAEKENRAAAVEVARTTLAAEKGREKALEEDVARCKMHAPEDGLVEYFVPERWTLGRNVDYVAAGETVKEGQLLMCILDPESLQVRMRVSEDCFPYIRAGLTATVQIDDFPSKPLVGHVAGTTEEPRQDGPSDRPATISSRSRKASGKGNWSSAIPGCWRPVSSPGGEEWRPAPVSDASRERL